MKLPHVRQIVISLFSRWGRGGSQRWSPLLKTQREAGISSWIVFLQSLGFDPLHPAVPSSSLLLSLLSRGGPSWGSTGGTDLGEGKPVVRRERSRVRRRHNTHVHSVWMETYDGLLPLETNHLCLLLTVNCPPISGLTKMDSQQGWTHGKIKLSQASHGGKEAVGLLVNAWGNLLMSLLSLQRLGSILLHCNSQWFLCYILFY